MKKILVVCAFLVATAPVFAQSLKEKKEIASHEESFKEELAQTNAACGTTVSGSIDWTSFLNGGVDLSKYGIGSGYCADGLSALRDLCSDAIGKEEVGKKVKAYVCRFGGTDKRAIAVSNGEVSASVDIEAANNSDFFKEQLENLL